MSEPEEYLTIEKLALRLGLEPKTIRNKMASGVFRRGVHYFSPKGLGPRFKWSSVIAWLEEKELEVVKANPDADRIPMAKGYYLGSNHLTRKPHSPIDFVGQNVQIVQCDDTGEV